MVGNTSQLPLIVSLIDRDLDLKERAQFKKIEMLATHQILPGHPYRMPRKTSGNESLEDALEYDREE